MHADFLSEFSSESLWCAQLAKGRGTAARGNAGGISGRKRVGDENGAGNGVGVGGLVSGVNWRWFRVEDVRADFLDCDGNGD